MAAAQAATVALAEMKAKDCEPVWSLREQLGGRFAASLELSVAKIITGAVRTDFE
jgi:hypothetical protein